MEVILLHQTFADGDAIGHDIQGMYDVLKKLNFSVSVFCEYNHTEQKYNIKKLDKVKKLVLEKQTLIIYHHSIFWSLGESILDAAKCRVIIRYHNITPPEFFDGYSEIYYQKTVEGYKQTERFSKKTDFFWLHDSFFNYTDILALGVKEEYCAVVAPFHKVEHMESLEADYSTLNNLVRGSRVNILFVGRISTNKGHMKICRVVKAYREMYGPDFTCWIVGGFDSELSKYNKELNEYIDRYGLNENIIFTQKVSIQTLKSYILGCDVFLCLSDHEGFCVPLIEAQYYKLPVVTWDKSAIKETVGDDQLVFSAFNADLIAAGIHSVATNKDISSYLIDKGLHNYYSRFKNHIIEENFVQVLQSIVDGRLSK